MEKTAVDFFLVKGILDNLFARIGLKNVSYKKETELNRNFHPGRCASIYSKDKMVGFITELHPRFLKENSLPRVVVFELNEDVILELINEPFKYEAITKFPSIERDLAIVCKKEIEAEQILSLIRQTARKTLTDIKVFDLYEGEGIGEGMKSIAVKMNFNDKTKTLETEDVDKTINSILKRLEMEFDAHLRA